MSEQTFSGSCLCGKVAYEISGEVQAFFHCHCGRCRKASGTGHASNVIVRYSQQSWTRGENLLRRYHVPDAERFHTVFCSECGSPMPRVAAQANIAVIGAGSLDNDPDLTVTGRIFQDSRAKWSCSGDGLPHWQQFPDKK
ncbi:GFA family protein [Woeseia oceani]|uniref:Aldehyde-activating protein n=1 Tax=Woeseia oceani TaxID=1548547 RepID=A0A193LKV2_9GAMM|nr:GFA family protein [Woeseia oceani]ANO53200.1 aldehyde-activating protein [Woeseia oceani]